MKWKNTLHNQKDAVTLISSQVSLIINIVVRIISQNLKSGDKINFFDAITAKHRHNRSFQSCAKRQKTQINSNVISGIKSNWQKSRNKRSEKTSHVNGFAIGIYKPNKFENCKWLFLLPPNKSSRRKLPNAIWINFPSRYLEQCQSFFYGLQFAGIFCLARFFFTNPIEIAPIIHFWL